MSPQTVRAGGRAKIGQPGFSLIELLVALAVFATMAALAYGGLDSVARTRAELGRQQDAFRDLMRGVGLIERDLRQAISRPVRGNYGEPLPALIGSSAHIEFTRTGFANPLAEPRSNLERVLYELDDAALKRGIYPVLDRAPATAPTLATLRSNVDSFRLRYLDASNRWSDTWPPLREAAAGAPDLLTQLPRAVEFRIGTSDYGEVAGVVELVSSWPSQAVP
ncbi:MAG TPA: type II secretion system minor pseudopilin GspJ [Rudaea sp.]|nr:type II secretion system minor pseudopilin GspJ [Rudaea sp.]